MSTFDIGIDINLQRLIETRILIQASSGAGKSFLMRKMMETFSGHIQQIVIDREGEFVTLREQFPLALLAVEGGDIPLNVHHAATYARKFMESQLSVIIDVSDLTPHDRQIFVRDFLQALMHLPKDLYHPLLMYIDEAQDFCPQDESALAGPAVIDMAVRGRKRDICIALGSQRVSKLHKDVTAELLNKVIGRTGQDIDQARAGKELDWRPMQYRDLRNLAPGEFYCFGPAFQEEVKKFKVAPVVTSHKRMGSGSMAPPTPKAIKSLIDALQDLPKEAEKELSTVEELKAELSRVIKEATGYKIELERPPSGKQDVRVPQLEDKIINLQSVVEAKNRHIEKLRLQVADAAQRVFDFSEKAAILQQELRNTANLEDVAVSELPISSPKREIIDSVKPLNPPSPPNRSNTRSPTIPAEEKPLGKCAKAILSFLAGYPGRDFTKAQIGVVTGYSVNSSGFLNSLSELTTKSLIIRGPRIKANPDARKAITEAIGKVEKQEFNPDTFKAKLGKCELEIYNILLGHPRSLFTKEQLAARTPSKYSPTSSGYLNSLSKLVTLELARRDTGMISLNPELLELL